MIPGNYNLEIYRGDTYRWTLLLWQDDERLTPYDLTNLSEAKAEVRDGPCGNLIITLDLTVEQPQTIKIELPANLSRQLPCARSRVPGQIVTWRGAWDLELTFESGDVNTILTGQVIVTPDITRSVENVTPAALRVVA